MDFLGCHVNNTPLIISSKIYIYISKGDINFHLIFPDGIISFTVMSSLTLMNGRNLELGGFSIGYVHVTSEPTDNQVSSFSLVGTIPLSLCPVRHL